MNFLLCNFGLKSYLWFQIKLVLCTHFILKSLIWFQTKLQSTQFNYHYLSWSSVPEPLPYPFPPVRPGNGWPHCRVFCCSAQLFWAQNHKVWGLIPYRDQRYVNPLTPNICLLILPFSYNTLPCKLFTRIWC